MPKNVTQYDLLISCPGDIADEINLINNAVDKFNQQFSDVLNISIRPRHWSKSSYAQSGGKPQDILNNQFVNDCDAAVAIFWTRFGTPTDRYGSGTEEEIENMLSSNKQVFMYFCTKPVDLSKVDYDEFKKVQEFKERYKKRGLYSVYNSNEEFDKLFFAHLTEFFISQKRIATLNSDRPELSIKGIDGDNVTSIAKISRYTPAIGGKTPEIVMTEITDTFTAINNLHLEKKSNASPFISGAIPAFNKPIVFEADTKETIEKIAESLDITLEADFFELGNLSKNETAALASVMGHSEQALIGTSEEKKKYNLVLHLESLFSTYIGISSFFNSFKDLFSIMLCLENNGGSYDEDIDIILGFPANILITPDEFPCKDSHQKKFLLDECDIEELFGIGATVKYMDYASSSKKLVHSRYSDPLYGRDINEDFQEELEDTFYYDFYPNGRQMYLKLHIDYIKQHTAVAFPSVLLLKAPVETIEYEITSKHNSEVIRSVLKIEKVNGHEA